MTTPNRYKGLILIGFLSVVAGVAGFAATAAIWQAQSPLWLLGLSGAVVAVGALVAVAGAALAWWHCG
jgi:hypothetical protein